MFLNKLKDFNMIKVLVRNFNLSHLKLEALVRKKNNDAIDGYPFIIGIITILKQFHSSEIELFLAYFGQYFRSKFDALKNVTKNVDVPPEMPVLIRFVEDFCALASIPRKTVDDVIPPFFFTKLNGNK